MCTQDNVYNNFVLSALHSEASPLLCLLRPSWLPCVPGRVGASTPPVGQETSNIFGVPFDHSGYAWGGGANKPSIINRLHLFWHI